MPENLLYYGDNLNVLQEHIESESVDLIYLDPPFNSNQDYNVLFREYDGTRAAAQIKAFSDTWEWNEDAERSYGLLIETGPPRIAQMIRAFRGFLGNSDMMAYLAMMAPRLLELHRVLRPKGSLYLHCDPTAGHYLKLLLDAIFGGKFFRSEIVWKRSGAHNDTKQGRKNYGHIHDVILFYSKSEDLVWNALYTPYADAYVGRDYQLIEEGTGRRYRRDNLTAARPGGDTEYLWRVKKHVGVRQRWEADIDDEYLEPRKGWEYRGVPPYRGRYWAYSQANMRQFAREGRLRHTFEGMPEYKRYLDEMPGVPLQDVWTDIPPIVAGTAERLGYPTQKPVALLERIILSSTNEGDTILDPFCGCGTTIAAAQETRRRWIGIDVTHLAIGLIRSRLQDAYGNGVIPKVVGEPEAETDARELARTDPFQFQLWSLGLVGARQHAADIKRGPDKGIDGRMYLRDGRGGHSQIIFSVKSGKLKADDIRALGHVVQREAAEQGVLISMHKPTPQMKADAASAGVYKSPWGDFPKLQIITVGELLEGKQIKRPYLTQGNATFTAARKSKRSPVAEPLELPLVTDPIAIIAERAEEEAKRREVALAVPSARRRSRKQGSTGSHSPQPAEAKVTPIQRRDSPRGADSR